MHVVVIGCGRVGSELSGALEHAGHTVAVVDKNGRAFRRLPPDLQIVAALALLEEQPYADIADALGIPEGTVKSRVFRALRLLRDELARLGVRP